jgi:hypothetical protein
MNAFPLATLRGALQYVRDEPYFHRCAPLGRRRRCLDGIKLSVRRSGEFAGLHVKFVPSRRR